MGDGILGHGLGGVAEGLRPGEVLVVLLRRLGQSLEKLVWVAQRQHLAGKGLKAAVVKIDAEHPNELPVLLDEHGAGAQDVPGGGDAGVVQAVVLPLIALVLQYAQGHVGQRRADFPPADIAVGNGDDGAVFVCQVVKGHFVVRAQGGAQEFRQLHILAQQGVGGIRHRSLLSVPWGGGSSTFFLILVLYY